MPISKLRETFKKRPEIPDAIAALRPNHGFSISLATGNNGAPGRDNYDWDTLYWSEGNPNPPPTVEETDAKLAELMAEWEAEEYARNRFLNYPKIEQQLAMLYDDIKAGVALSEGTWFNSVKEVKEQNPKPE
jgi:hypothetical protein